MKQVFTLVLMLMTICLVAKQTRLYPPPKPCKTTWADFGLKGRVSEYSGVEIIFGDTSQYTFIRQFNEKGLLVYQDIMIRWDNITRYEYNQSGRIIKHWDQMSEGTCYTTFSYDSDGYLLGIKDYIDGALYMANTYTYGDSLYSIKEVSDYNTVIRTFNAVGVQISLTEFDANGNQLPSRFEYYPEQRLVVEHSSFGSSGQVENFLDKTQYDMQWRPVEEIRCSEANTAEVHVHRKFEYDNEGNLVKHTYKLGLDEDYNQVNFDYGYDTQGNITRINSHYNWADEAFTNQITYEYYSQRR